MQMNDKPFDHVSHFGTKFVAPKADFRDGVIIHRSVHLDDVHFLSDLAEMIGYHAVNIHPELNGFQGYDCINFKIMLDRT
jgi:hypothetical protein